MTFEKEIKKYLNSNPPRIKDVDVANIPQEDGIYIVALVDNGKIEISDKTTAITSYTKNDKKINLLYDKTKLEDKLKKSHKKYLYIGKAEQKNGGLRTRINCLINYANSKCINHRGGRALWQIKNWREQLCIHWYKTKNAEKIEKSLLKLHRDDFGEYPFANWRI